jgi:hypothetical protein
MTQLITRFVIGFITGGFGGFLAFSLISAKTAARAERGRDDEQVEALIASRIEPDLMDAVRLTN